MLEYLNDEYYIEKKNYQKIKYMLLELIPDVLL